MLEVVFWLDSEIGFDKCVPEIISNFADGLASLGYDVELLVETKSLDNFRVNRARKKLYFHGENHCIVTDIIISNSLDYLMNSDLYRTGKKLWLALETESVKKFENYPIGEDLKVLTLNPKVKENLNNLKIDASYLQPGLDLVKFKDISLLEKDNWGIIINYFHSTSEILLKVIEGLELTLTSLNRVKVYLLSDEKHYFESATGLTVETKIKPSIDERIKIYEKADILLHFSDKEFFSLIPLEAMAAGIPVISLLNSGISGYARDGENLIILKKPDPTDIALSILNIIKIGKIRYQLKTYGLRTVQNYDLKQSIESLAQLLSQKISLINRDLNQSEKVPNKEGVDIVIINYGSKDRLEECLNAIKENTEDSIYEYRIIVVDNGSEDDRINYLKEITGVNLIINSSPTGFAKAYNQGILAGKGDYIIIMESGVMVEEGWLKPLLSEIKKSEVAVVIPEASGENVNYNQKEKIDVLKNLEENRSLEMGIDLDFKDIESGISCLVIKRELLNRIGLFDEKILLHYEVFDYILRAREKGYNVRYCPDSFIFYKKEPSGENKKDEESGMLNQSKKYFKTKWGSFRPDTVTERKGDGIVIFGLNPFQKRVERTDAIINFFCNRGQKIVYVEPYCASVSPMNYGQNQYIYIPDGKGTIYYNMQYPGYRVEFTCQLQKHLNQWGIKNPVFIIEAPWWEAILKHLEHLYQVYITPETLLGDDMETFQQLRSKFESEEKRILKSADLIIAGSKKRCEDLVEYSEKLLYNPGGFSSNSVERFSQGHFTIPDELLSLTGLKIGILGTFNHYVSFHLLETIIQKYPEISFVVIGDVTRDLGELSNIPNIFFLGNKTANSLLDYLYFMDLLFYPYEDKGLNSYIDPYLINYCLAMGKPIVAFNHRELDRFEDNLNKANSEKEFIEMVDDMIKDLKDVKKGSMSRVEWDLSGRESWEEKISQIYELIAGKINFLSPLSVKQVGEVSSETVQKLPQSVIKKITGFFGRYLHGKGKDE